MGVKFQKPLGNGSYGEFVVTDPQLERMSLLAGWSTPEQRGYNATHDICSTCKGKGYPWKEDKKAPDIGCVTCGGTGGVPAGSGTKKRHVNELYLQEVANGR